MKRGDPSKIYSVTYKRDLLYTGVATGAGTKGISASIYTSPIGDDSLGFSTFNG